VPAITLGEADRQLGPSRESLRCWQSPLRNGFYPGRL